MLGLLQADAELCQGSLQAALASPEANGRAPDYVCSTHRGSRSRLFICKSMSCVSCPSRGWPLGWVFMAVSMAQVLHHSEHSCDGREHRLEDITGRGVWVFQSSFPFIRDLMFPFLANFYSMQLSYSIRGEDIPPKLCESIRRGSAVLPALNIPWTFFQLLNWSPTQAALSGLCPRIYGVWTITDLEVVSNAKFLSLKAQYDDVNLNISLS